MDVHKRKKVGAIPCLTFVKKGVSNQHLTKEKLEPTELKKVITDLQLRSAEYKSRPNEERQPIEGEPMSDDDAQNEDANAVDDYYDMDDYDDEPVEPGMGILDPMSNTAEEISDDSDSEDDEEDVMVKPDDNLIIAGQVSDDVCLLQTYVLNTEEHDFFLLNDTYLPSYPISLEWLDYNRENDGRGKHLAAVGYMIPEIHIWDLNLADCLEPKYVLGPKKQKNSLRHTDAVMDLSWNTGARNVLASSSADQTVIIWDLQELKFVTRLDGFMDKVQTIKWHPFEPQHLLTGTCNGAVRLFDVRTREKVKAWKFDGEIERVIWNQYDPLHFLASTEMGKVHYVDFRNLKPLWELKAHTGAVGGIALSSACRDLLMTGGEDEIARVWDIKNASTLEGDEKVPCLVAEKQMNIGHIYTISVCQDSGYVFAAGGNKPDNHLYVWDVRETEKIIDTFKDRFIDRPSSAEDMDESNSNSKPMPEGFIFTENAAKQGKKIKPTKKQSPTTSYGGPNPEHPQSSASSAGPSSSSAAGQSVKNVTKKKKKKGKQ